MGVLVVRMPDDNKIAATRFGRRGGGSVDSTASDMQLFSAARSQAVVCLRPSAPPFRLKSVTLTLTAACPLGL